MAASGPRPTGSPEPAAQLTVSTRQVDDAVVVAAAGAADLVSAPLLDNVLAGSPSVLIIDLSAVDFLASMG